MKSDLVIIEHPDLKGTRTVPKRSFDIVWSSRGWLISGDNTAETTAEDGDSVDLAELDHSDLIMYADDRNIPISIRWGVKRLRKEIEAFQTGDGPEADTDQGHEPDDAQEG